MFKPFFLKIQKMKIFATPVDNAIGPDRIGQILKL